MPAVMTIAEQLAAAGFGYRQSKMQGRREVFRLADGVVIGQFTASDAIAFLEEL